MARRRFFRIRNWDKFQGYKKRGPEWIKLYTSLLAHYEFQLLPDSKKWHVIGLWLLAANTSNRLPWDPKWLQNKCGFDCEPDLSELQSLEFIEIWCDTSVADVATKVSHTRAREERRVEESREERDSMATSPSNGASVPAACPLQKIIQLYHQHCPTLKPVRKAALVETELRVRWREVLAGKDRDNGIGPREPELALQWFENFFVRVQRSDWLAGRACGRDGQPFRHGRLAWLVKRENFYKILEGTYD